MCDKVDGAGSPASAKAQLVTSSVYKGKPGILQKETVCQHCKNAVRGLSFLDCSS